MLTGEDEVAFIGDGPLDGFALGEVHVLSNGSWEVDVPLLTILTLNDLNFSWITHVTIFMQLKLLTSPTNAEVSYRKLSEDEDEKDSSPIDRSLCLIPKATFQVL